MGVSLGIGILEAVTDGFDKVLVNDFSCRARGKKGLCGHHFCVMCPESGNNAAYPLDRMRRMFLKGHCSGGSYSFKFFCRL